jgi:isopentenyldiphosphate isomerase
LAQRKFNKKYNPGKWGPAVGGTVEEGETYESNIYKEAREEIGLTDRTFNTGPKVFNTEPNRKFCQIYTLRADIPIENFRIQEEEVEAIKWVDKDELKKELENNPDDYTPTVHMMLKE